MSDLGKLRHRWINIKRIIKRFLIRLTSPVEKSVIVNSTQDLSKKNEIELLKKSCQQSFYDWKKRDKCKVLFHRDYRGYSGGHLKVFDYYKHLIDLGCDVDIFFTSRSVWDNQENVNPWIDETDNIVSTYTPKDYDLLFVEGMDWAFLEPGIEETMPVISFVQGFRQTNKEHTLLYSFLYRKATRIAVSNEVAESMMLTNDANGPIHAIPNGIQLPEISMKKTNDIYIMGKKHTKLAQELNEYFAGMGYRTICTTKNIFRDEVLLNMAKSSISILLSSPGIHEGFFLPALESMKYSDMTVVPDCRGNRSFCFDGENCLMPDDYTKEDIILKTEQALDILKDEKKLGQYKFQAQLTVKSYSIEAEKISFYKLVNEIFVREGVCGVDDANIKTTV